MSGPARDKWAEWLLERRCVGDPGKHRAVLEHYHRWRDGVLANAAVGEGDLFALAEGAGFGEVKLDYEAKTAPYDASGDDEARDWKSFAQIPGNPKIPNLEEAMIEALTPEEAERFVVHLRPLVERGRGMERWTVARLWAVK